MVLNARHLQPAVLALILLSCLPAPAYDFAGGAGTPADPYQIATAAQLISLGSDPNLLDKHFVLLNDLDLDPNLPGGRVFTRAVIAPDMNEAAALFQGVRFKGDFDGNGKVIANLTVKSLSSDYLGLFGGLAAEARVRDLELTTAQITGGEKAQLAGPLAGSNYGSITNCKANATVSGTKYVGGLVGGNGGVITNCHVSADIFDWDDTAGSHGGGGLVGENAGILAQSSAHARITGGSRLGGLAGPNSGLIWRCFASGEVTGENYLGGLVGEAFWQGTIENCYATVSVSSELIFLEVGGLVGYYGSGTIANCYAAGAIHNGVNETEEWDWGGLIGWSSALNPAIVNSFWDTTVSGVQQSAAGKGLTTAEMQTAATFIGAGWNFESTWTICEGGGYPRLRWEGVACAP